MIASAKLPIVVDENGKATEKYILVTADPSLNAGRNYEKEFHEDFKKLQARLSSKNPSLEDTLRSLWVIVETFTKSIPDFDTFVSYFTYKPFADGLVKLVNHASESAVTPKNS